MPCSFYVSPASSWFLVTNQPPAIKQCYFSLIINQHQPPTKQTSYRLLGRSSSTCEPFPGSSSSCPPPTTPLCHILKVSSRQRRRESSLRGRTTAVLPHRPCPRRCATRPYPCPPHAQLSRPTSALRPIPMPFTPTRGANNLESALGEWVGLPSLEILQV